jgi:hypothetical protein
MSAAPFARGGGIVTEWCDFAYPPSHHKSRISYPKKTEDGDAPFDPQSPLPFTLEKFPPGSGVRHFRPSSFPERSAETSPDLRSEQDYYEWVPVPDRRTARNQKIRPRFRLKKQRAIVYILPLHLRKEQKKARMWRSRAHKTLKPPVWQGEIRPCGARGVSANSNYPAVDYLVRLCRDLGYSITAAIAAVAVSTSEFIVDRRSSSVSEDEDWDEQSPCESSHKIVDPSHPYIASAPARRTLSGGGITIEQITHKLRAHSWSLGMQEGVIDVLVKRRSPKEVAAVRELNYQTLKNNSRLIRQKIQGSGADLHVDVR